MTHRLLKWMTMKWRRSEPAPLMQSYRQVFSSLHGQFVLNHLLDSVYCTVYEGKDPVELAFHNGRRSLVHEILVNIDMAEQPDKYHPEVSHG